MPRTKILQEDQSYTYRSYFEMPYEADEILAEFGYSFVTKRLQLPTSNQRLERLSELRRQIEETLPLIRLSSETARRETIALAQVEETDIIYGAVTIGDVWRFSKLEVKERRIIQDITLYRVPDDLEPLSQILIGIIDY